MMEQKEKKQRFLTPAEVAKLLRCHVKTVREEIHSGNLIASKIGRAFIIDTADLESYIKARKVKAHA